MRSHRNETSGIEASLTAIAALPEDQKIDALLHILSNALRELPLQTLRKKRARFLAHFAQCGCSFEVCCAVQDLVDLHLAKRTSQASDQLIGSSRKTGGSERLRARF